MSLAAHIEVSAVREMYGQGIKTRIIAEQLGVEDQSIRRLIFKERKRDPGAWGYRKPGSGIHEWRPPDPEKIAEREQQEREQSPQYLAGEQFDLTWNVRDVAIFDKMWRAGYHIVDIAEYFGRPVAEIVFLVLDRAEAKRIEPRDGGIFGRDA